MEASGSFSAVGSKTGFHGHLGKCPEIQEPKASLL